jgi:hypothetical protein
MFTSSLILKAYELTATSDANEKQHDKQRTTKLLRFNQARHGADLLVPLNFYLDSLNDVEPVFFPYMTEVQLKETQRTLQVTYLFLLAEQKYELAHQKKENSNRYNETILQCEHFIDELKCHLHCRKQNIIPSPEQGLLSAEKPTAYLGLAAGNLLAESMVKVASGSATKTMMNQMEWVNDKRLYWVWASSVLKSILTNFPFDFLPVDPNRVDKAATLISQPDLYSGTMSWGLYYFRFALNLGLLLKHTLSGPWMSKVEEREPWTERFCTQWDQRKFVLLNDFVWATGNLACFFWLYGKGALGTWGDVLTLGLLVFDIGLAMWDFEEQQTRYKKQMLDYDETITQLEQKKELLINHLNNTKEALQQQLDRLNIELDMEVKQKKKRQIRAEINTIEQQLKDYEEQKNEAALFELNTALAALKRARTQCDREWSIQVQHLTINKTYALGLMLSFAILAVPFLPVGGPLIAAMTVVGALLCFSFSIISDAVKGRVGLQKTQTTQRNLQALYKEKIIQFKELTVDVDPNAKKLLFLEITKLLVENEHQEKTLKLQTIHLVHTILIESLIPPLVLLSFVFLPLGAGLGVLAAAVALAAVSHLLIDALIKVEKGEINAFDEKEYQAFCLDPDHWHRPINTKTGFFQAPAKTVQKTPEESPFNVQDTPSLGCGSAPAKTGE